MQQKVMVYRIIQEQTNNIIKYAETKTAGICLQDNGKEVELIITDKGKGFVKTEQKLTGIGFVNIQHRVDAYNGTLEIYSAPGEGCRLQVWFPLHDG
jgi:signal transduction histidine kinase